ncbi:hypothetical protein CYMTET_28501 [Cymbomonas tetramitiformis]|uniref:Uncharacterized protein n=1 Tax=Cymbomonas tetramitiformis TaxID=36881 RepID=A0AAE0FP83_9CHLO|nr:hypothetical protein CYMTET_28501 [Cymbomonas tetramitiformis]
MRGRKAAPPVLMRKSPGWGNDGRRTNQYWERQQQRSREERREEWTQWEREEMILEQQRAKQLTEKRTELRQQGQQDLDKRRRDLQTFWQTMAKVDRAKEARLSEWEEKVRMYDENRDSEGWGFRDGRRGGREDVTEDGYADTRFPDRRSMDAPRGRYGEPPPRRGVQGGGRRALRSEERSRGPERAPERRASRSSPPFGRRREPTETDLRSSSNDRRREPTETDFRSSSNDRRREPTETDLRSSSNDRRREPTETDFRSSSNDRRRGPTETDFRSSSNDRRQPEGFRRGSPPPSSNARREPDSREDLSQWIELGGTPRRQPNSSMPPGAYDERDTGKAFQAGDGRSWKRNGGAVEGAFSSERETGRNLNGGEDRINVRRRERRPPSSRPPSR